MKGMMIDENYDLVIKGGQLTLGEVEPQVCELALVATPSDFKEHPAIGAELKKMLGGESDIMWTVKTKKMLRSCGVEVEKIVIDENTVTVM